ncbi:MAG: glycosyltransferase [Candidatus Lokiarchaeia archaeon]
MKIGIVSPYPSIGSKHTEESGVASYTKNLVYSIKNFIHDVSVFANNFGSNLKYFEDGIVISRCWNKGVRYPFQVLRNVLMKKEQVNIMHIQFEVFLYGGLFSILVFPLLLILLKLFNISTVTTIHQVVPLPKVDRQFLKKNNFSGTPFLLKIGLFLLIHIITSLSNKVIVHEFPFKKILIDHYRSKSSKVVVIPHGIEEKKDLIDKNKAKEVLNLEDNKVILFFGYITGYKGIELLINSFKYKYLKNNLTLLISGGMHPRLKVDPSYKLYLRSLEKRASTISKNIIFTGFLPEEQIPLFFSAADLIVFPYTLAMSSSGPMSFAVAYEKPFLVSDAFKDIVKLDEIIFSKDPENLAKKIEQFFSNKDLEKKCLNYIKRVKEERSWKNIAKRTLKIYNNVFITRV